MIDCRFRPISEWPGKRTPAAERGSKYTFKATYADTLDFLERELRHLHATNIVIEAFFRLDQIRNDGWPFGKATPSAPGVVVSFQSNKGPLRLPCDHLPQWEHNLRAIAYHLEHLRMASKYGVGMAGQAYTGWKQIAAPGATVTMTVEDAALFVALQTVPSDEAKGVADKIVRAGEEYRTSYREAAAKLHPDVNSNVSLWHILQEAKALLDAHHGIAAKQEARE